MNGYLPPNYGPTATSASPPLQVFVDGEDLTNKILVIHFKTRENTDEPVTGYIETMSPHQWSITPSSG